MPIVQVSRITQRKGLVQDLPEPLASAELGWAIDERRLFIGNGTLAEGAPVVGNTEVLTEFSDILNFATTYTYKGDAGGYTVQTGPNASSPVSQSLQDRLDSYAVVTDFGAVGDGITDDTAAINRALFQLYCRQTNPQVRRSLFFPAGVYVVTDTLLIPSYAKLYGEGANSSIISFLVLPWAANTLYPADILVKNSGSYYRSKIPIDTTGITLANTTYWELVALPDYVARTADSQQQVGINIGTLNAISPRNIEIDGLRFQTSESGGGVTTHDVFLVEKAQQCTFRGVNFAGALEGANIEVSTPDLSGMTFSSNPSLVCTDITIDDCGFSNLTYGITANDATKSIVVSNSRFQDLFKGVVLGGIAPANGGPTGFRVMHNVFDQIYEQGVIIQGCALNATAYNTFYDVGNHLNGVSFPATSIISILATNNISVGDMFQRTQSQSLVPPGYPRIFLLDPSTSTVPVTMASSSADQLQIGATVYRAMANPANDQPRVQAPILDGASNQLLFQVNTSLSLSNGGFWSFDMEYTILRFTSGTRAVRKGTLTVVAGGDDSAGEGLVYTDEFIDNEFTDTQFTVTESSNVVSVFVSASATGFNGIIYYTVRYQA